MDVFQLMSNIIRILERPLNEKYLQNTNVDIFSYSPKVQSVFQSLTEYGIVLQQTHLDYQ